jgi:transcriptional regulator with XRE-family HTH domain
VKCRVVPSAGGGQTAVRAEGLPLSEREMAGLRDLGTVIKRARLGLGWSQRGLESRSGVDQTTISRLENGRLVISACSASRLSSRRCAAASISTISSDPIEPTSDHPCPRSPPEPEVPTRARSDATNGIAEGQRKFWCAHEAAPWAARRSAGRDHDRGPPAGQALDQQVAEQPDQVSWPMPAPRASEVPDGRHPDVGEAGVGQPSFEVAR